MTDLGDDGRHSRQFTVSVCGIALTICGPLFGALAAVFFAGWSHFSHRRTLRRLGRRSSRQGEDRQFAVDETLHIAQQFFLVGAHQ